MTTITLNDLPQSKELDLAALETVTGGFLDALVPYMTPTSDYLPTINNFFVQYEQNIFQQNPTNISIFNGDTGGDIINNISTNSLTAASPMTFTRISGMLPGAFA